jgi:hypothetical protein
VRTQRLVPVHDQMESADAPAVDFDLSDPLSRFRLGALMIWPNKKSSRLARLAMMGIDSKGVKEPYYLALVKAVLTASAHRRPARGTVEKLLSALDCDPSVDHALRQWAYGHSRSYAALAGSQRPTGAISDWERDFWSWVFRPSVRNPLESAPSSLFYPPLDRLIAESGGYAAAAGSPGMDELDVEFRNGYLGYPMLSGLALILIQIFKQHHDKEHPPVIEPSLTSACRTIAGLEVIPGKYNEVKRYWPVYSPVAPLWAGFLIEMGCLHPQSLINLTLLTVERWAEIATSLSRTRQMLSFARPFCDLLRTHRSGGKALTPHPERVVRIPDTISAAPATLFRLEGEALKKALPALSAGNS